MRAAEADPSAVHDRFRGEDRLLEAVLDRVVEPITDHRFERLGELGRELAGEPNPSAASSTPPVAGSRTEHRIEPLAARCGNHFPMCDDPDAVAAWIRAWHRDRVVTRTEASA